MEMTPIQDVAKTLGLGLTDYEPYGHFKAKLALDLFDQLKDRPDGKYVFVSAINPTPLGEGKTVVTIGLSMALCRLGHRAIPTLRQPSIAPVFGVKGGGAGGGRSHLMPFEDINLHLTGDLHAIAAANNLLAAMIDNHVKRELRPLITLESLRWRRAIDISDKALGHIQVGLKGGLAGPQRETGFDLTAASEVMAILSLAEDLTDLRQRIARILVGTTPDGEPVRAEDIGAAGAMTALLKDAIRPNLVQTCEGTPAFVHTGPFANIAHGNCSIVSDRIALKLSDYTVTECGFGADCGGEKLIDIKCRIGNLRPSAGVIVCSVRALKWHSGRFGTKATPKITQKLVREDVPALREGAANLAAQINILRMAGIPAIVAINRFPSDTEAELSAAVDEAKAAGAVAAHPVDAFTMGGEGCLALARAVVEASKAPPQLHFFYEDAASPLEKLNALATQVYGADGVEVSEKAHAGLELATRLKMDRLPFCIAKTQYSLSHNPALLGRPKGFKMVVRDIGLYAGAGFLYALCGDIVTLPGLPKEPAALKIDVDARGNITGLR